MAEPTADHPDRPRRILLHVGVHKTGTTSLQACLRQNARALAPHWQVQTRPSHENLRLVAEAARAYSVSLASGKGAAGDLAFFRAECVLWLAEAGLKPGQGLMASTEDFAGRMPGTHRIRDYAALPMLMAALLDTAGMVFPEGVDLTVLITTRARTDWLTSLHRHQVRGHHRQTLDEAAFILRYGDAADHARLHAEVSRAIAPHAVHLVAVEDASARPLGPVEALLDLAQLPGPLRASLAPAARQNVAPSVDLTEAFLALNRSDMKLKELQDLKGRLQRAADAGLPLPDWRASL